MLLLWNYWVSILHSFTDGFDSIFPRGVLADSDVYASP